MQIGFARPQTVTPLSSSLVLLVFLLSFTRTVAFSGAGSSTLSITGRMHASMARFSRLRPLLRAVNGASMSSGASGRASAVASHNKQSSAPQPVLDCSPPRGTRDFYPEDMRVRQWLFNTWRDTAEKFGFEEYDAPVVEHEQLYTSKAGEQVAQQLYSFEDKSGRKLALRPEITPSLARMIAGRGSALHAPIKWFSIPQCWRYERMSKGRKREHYQWNVDIWGVQGVQAEVELMGSLVTAFTKLGLTAGDVGIKVNNRKVLFGVLKALGVRDDALVSTCIVIDKLDKLPQAEIEKTLREDGWSSEHVAKLMNFLASRNLEDVASQLAALNIANNDGLDELRELWQLAEAYNAHDWLVFDASVVRGLAYYTGIVFEAFDRKGEFRAICGGGRYDNAAAAFGGARMPAVGFGFGDAVIVELLKERNLLPNTTLPQIDVSVFMMEEQLRPAAMKVAQAIRERGLRCDLILEHKKLKAALKHGERVGASKMIIVAPDEYAQNKIAVKDLRTGTQTNGTVEEMIAALSKSQL